MHRINIISDIGQEYLMEDKEIKNHKKIKRRKDRSIKIDDSLFDIALREGLIEKTEDGYLFIGEYNDLIAFRNRKK